MNSSPSPKQTSFIARLRQHGIFAPLRGRGLKALALKGSAWTVLGYGGSQAMRFGTNIILARLLFPEAFGLMALVAVLQQGLAMFSDVGLAQGIIQTKHGSNPVYLNTAWTLQAIRGVVIWLIICVIAKPFAGFYNDPVLSTILPIVGFSALISGFNSIKLITNNRDLLLHKIISIEVISQFLSAVTMVIWCLIAPSIWALVAGGLLFSVVRMVAGHLWLPGHNASLAWDKTSAKELFSFGRWITFSSALSFIASMGDRLIFGKLFPIAFLGVYVIAANLKRVPEDLIMNLGTRVIFPALSHVNRENPAALRLSVKKIRLILGLFGAVCAGAIAALSGTIVDFLYDDRYSEAGWMLQLLCIQLGLACIAMPASNVILALGDTRRLFFLSIYRVVWLVVIVIPTAYLLGAKQAIIAILLSGIGSVIILNFFLWKKKLYMPQIEFAVTMVAIVVYLLFRLALISIK